MISLLLLFDCQSHIQAMIQTQIQCFLWSSKTDFSFDWSQLNRLTPDMSVFALVMNLVGKEEMYTMLWLLMDIQLLCFLWNL